MFCVLPPTTVQERRLTSSKQQLVQGLVVAGAVCLRGASCLPENRTDDQVNAAIQAGTFENPSVNVRPRFRYWIPDASADLTTVAQDIASAKDAGAGGIEVLGYYDYGASPGNFVPVDWSTYGWGTPAWSKLHQPACRDEMTRTVPIFWALSR